MGGREGGVDFAARKKQILNLKNNSDCLIGTTERKQVALFLIKLSRECLAFYSYESLGALIVGAGLTGVNVASYSSETQALM